MYRYEHAFDGVLLNALLSVFQYQLYALHDLVIDDMLAIMFGVAALFRCMIGFSHVRRMLGLLMCVWLSFALWIDMLFWDKRCHVVC